MSGASGILFRVDGALYFLPASIATKVLPMPNVARMAGAPALLVGIALVDGETLPVVAVTDLGARGSQRPPPADGARADNRPLLVCTVSGEKVGLVGLSIVKTGRFETSDASAVEHEGEIASSFDVAAVISRLREHRWAV